MTKKKKHNPTDNLKPFKKNDPRINRKGRPKNIPDKLLEEFKDNGIKMITTGQVMNAYRIMLNTTKEAIEEVYNNPKASNGVRLIAGHILRAYEDPVELKMLLNRVIGRPTEYKEVIQEVRSSTEKEVVVLKVPNIKEPDNH